MKYAEMPFNISHLILGLAFLMVLMMFMQMLSKNLIFQEVLYENIMIKPCQENQV
jgi:hypothetical protein